MTFQIDFIAFTGLDCLEKATLEQFDEIEGIAQKTIQYLEEGIRRSWTGDKDGQKLSWLRTMNVPSEENRAV